MLTTGLSGLTEAWDYDYDYHAHFRHIHIFLCNAKRVSTETHLNIIRAHGNTQRKLQTGYFVFLVKCRVKISACSFQFFSNNSWPLMISRGVQTHCVTVFFSIKLQCGGTGRKILFNDVVTLTAVT